MSGIAPLRTRAPASRGGEGSFASNAGPSGPGSWLPPGWTAGAIARVMAPDAPELGMMSPTP